MMLLVFFASLVPTAALYAWLRGVRKDEGYRMTCRSALLRGLLSVFPIVLFSGLLHVAGNLAGLQDLHPLLYRAYYTFIVLALIEELVKYWMFRLTLKKSTYAYSWMDVAIFMAIVGIGFGLMEQIPVSIGEGIGVMAVRGLSIPHGAYGFMMGYFLGKSRKTGRKSVGVWGFLLTWLLHGLYDFGLSKEFLAVNENLAFVPFSIAVMDFVLIFLLIRFVVRAKKQEIYLEPICGAPGAEEEKNAPAEGGKQERERRR